MPDAIAFSWRQYRLERRMFWRNPSAAFFNFVLPLLFLVAGGVILSGNQDALNKLVPSIAGMSVMSTTFTALAYNLTFLREQGFRQLLSRIQSRQLRSDAAPAETAAAPPPIPDKPTQQYELVQDEAALDRWIAESHTAGIIGFDTETTSLNAVAAELVEQRGLGRLLRCRLGLLHGRVVQQALDLVADLLQVRAQILEHVRRDSLTLDEQAQQQMLGADVVVPHPPRLFEGDLDHLLHARGTAECSRMFATLLKAAVDSCS